jgi:putative hydrolase of the HAD superfamily
MENSVLTIKAVLFDMGGTLITAATLEEVIKIYDKILQAYGMSYSLDRIAKAHQKASRQLDISRLADVGKDFWVMFNLILLKDLGMDKNQALDLAKTIDREWWDYADVELYPDVLPVLHELKARKLKLGIVSNGLESDIEHVMKKVNLEGFFDVEVGVDTFMCMKPNREVFLKTLKLLQVSPKETLFVGDSLENDYEGARNAGIRALLISRRNNVTNCEVEKFIAFGNYLVSYKLRVSFASQRNICTRTSSDAIS